MGRRALSKVRLNEQENFSRYFKIPEELSKPLSSVEVFSRDAPLELEIGSGKGLFIRNAARLNPEHNFLGIEIGKKYAIFSAAGIMKANLQNAVMLCGDAAKFLHEGIAPDSLHAIHVYFPDPWWKRAHKKRRILREEVLKLIERALQPGGTLYFRTDVLEYYDTTLKLIAKTTKLQGPFEIEENEPEHDMDYHTHFERRTRLNEAPVYRSFFRKES